MFKKLISCILTVGMFIMGVSAFAADAAAANNAASTTTATKTVVVNVTSFRIINNHTQGTPSFTLSATLSQNMVYDPNVRYQLGNTEAMIEAVSNYAGMFFSNAIMGNTLDIIEINGGGETFGAQLEQDIAAISEGSSNYVSWNGVNWVKSCETKIVNVTSFGIDLKSNQGTPLFALCSTLSEAMIKDENIRYQLGNTEDMIDEVSNYAGVFFCIASMDGEFDIIEINGGGETFGAQLEQDIAAISEGGSYFLRWNGKEWIKSCN